MLDTEPTLIATALALIGRHGTLSPAEQEVAAGIAPEPDRAGLAALRAAIRAKVKGSTPTPRPRARSAVPGESGGPGAATNRRGRHALRQTA